MIKSTFGSRRGLLALVREEAQWWLGPDRATSVSLDGVTRLVFVCRGNICRSAFAAEVSRSIGFPAVSFGLRTQHGHHANAGMVAAASLRGHDLSNHRTSPIASYEALKGDLVVVFELSQLQQVKQLVPNAAVMLLGRMARPPRTYIHDPFGTTPEFYNRSSGLIESATKRLIARVRERSNVTHALAAQP
jgi:protein-tyrosine phosphatase